MNWNLFKLVPLGLLRIRTVHTLACPSQTQAFSGLCIHCNGLSLTDIGLLRTVHTLACPSQTLVFSGLCIHCNGLSLTDIGLCIHQLVTDIGLLQLSIIIKHKFWLLQRLARFNHIFLLLFESLTNFDKMVNWFFIFWIVFSQFLYSEFNLDTALWKEFQYTSAVMVFIRMKVGKNN